MRSLWKNKRGATGIEYGIIAALIAVPVVAVLSVDNKEIPGLSASPVGQLQNILGLIGFVTATPTDRDQTQFVAAQIGACKKNGGRPVVILDGPNGSPSDMNCL